MPRKTCPHTVAMHMSMYMSALMLCTHALCTCSVYSAHIWTYVHTHVHTHVCTHVCTVLDTRVCTHACTHARQHLHACLRTCLCACLYTHVHTLSMYRCTNWPTWRRPTRSTGPAPWPARVSPMLERTMAARYAYNDYHSRSFRRTAIWTSVDEYDRPSLTVIMV